ncbi:Fur family transcriptional regulator [Ideonella oryzae]|uniref:Ferric uptake regulation protein n=1 Tax=Ideonella oryzae TaxID=2937441 RepID=A0ABT1BN45_9BURK|nr:transcriptional repressor [Ideonella oryzae]MCO5977643.1 transcriptional repressor [Ideonella oryzae]
MPATPDTALQVRLQQAGIGPTLQRLAIAEVLLRQPCHMTADQVLAAARRWLPSLSRATVYGTLQLFVRQGLLRELPIDGEATVYDSNLAPHHHLYHEDTGEVSDVPAEALQVLGLPALGEGLELAAVDVIVRVRRRGSRPAAA